ncbi:N-acetylmuramidase domain-containing protein [Reyranella sp.]|uniref:N-acetylmuramidase domain-containing protein n=1 Tax=Reyranella sp. TaxID=1929291 RepID=UPI003D13A525
MFDTADYQRAAARLECPVAHVMAMAAVESSGETFWALNGRLVVPVRFEAHWFGKLTGYRFNDSHPDLSCVEWSPALAATTRAGAWEQLERARVLDRDAANQAASHGAFQVMGFQWKRLGYPSVQAFVDSMSADGDDGQMDAFVRYVEADPALRASLSIGAWRDVEQRYNGGGQGGAYAVKLKAAAALYGGGAALSTAPRVLRKGDKGADVVAVQTALGIRADGDFGPLTDQAVRLFQADRGLVVDGIAGAMTRRALGI